MNFAKAGIVARFELAEALRSRLVIVILTLYGAGAALGAYVFSKALGAAEQAVRSNMPTALGAPDVPDDLVRKQALPRVISGLVDDPVLREELVGIEPLALFYGFMALQLVALLVLFASGGAHASDVSRGVTRFVLTRCDRFSWALGKLVGHAALLAAGLLAGALVTMAVGWAQGRFDAVSALWLLRAALRAWTYGLAYLGLFAGIALSLRAPGPARAFSVLLLFGLWIARSIVRSEWLGRAIPGIEHIAWLFPAEYEKLLWSPNWLVSWSASIALIAIGAAGFALGQWAFRRSDA